MKHALFIAFHYPPEAGSSGVLRTLKYTRYLGDYGWRVTVIAPRADAYAVVDPQLEAQIPAGVRVVRTAGHTAHHQAVFLESAGKTAVFPADLVPTAAHVHDGWIPALDLYPVESFAFKQRFLREAIDREYLIFFVHDPAISAGYIREKDGKRFVQKVI